MSTWHLRASWDLDYTRWAAWRHFMFYLGCFFMFECESPSTSLFATLFCCVHSFFFMSPSTRVLHWVGYPQKQLICGWFFLTFFFPGSDLGGKNNMRVGSRVTRCNWTRESTCCHRSDNKQRRFQITILTWSLISEDRFRYFATCSCWRALGLDERISMAATVWQQQVPLPEITILTWSLISEDRFHNVELLTQAPLPKQ